MVGLAEKDKGKPAPIIPGLKIKGDTIAGRYRVEKLLGAGSSGFVVAARHVYLRQGVTLKLLTSTTNAHQEAQRRHLAAAHQAAALCGPHIARVIDTGFTEDGMPFIATERLEGRTLADELAVRTHLPAVEAVRWILQACEGLAEAHSAGIVHGDLKPQNLFLAADSKGSSTDQGGEARVLKVLDFGMATPVDATGDEGTSPWFASPAYLAPEQIGATNAVDERTDVWALGVVLYEAIAGHLPFTSDTISGMLIAVVRDEPAMLTAQDVSFELARVVHACISKDPAGRPPDVVTLARQLAPFAGADGLARARRVDAARSSPHGRTNDREVQAADGKAEPSSNGPGVSTEAPPAAREHREVAVRRRRRGAIATVGAAAALAVAGMLSSPTPRAETKGNVDAVQLPPAQAHGTPPPFIPPSFRFDDESETREASPPPVPQPPPAAKPRREPPTSQQRAAPGAKASARVLARELPANKPRASLAVREDPYARGFTHPTRLPDRPK
jgi:serine/threonine protein kinase